MFLKTWCDDLYNFTYTLPNYASSHQKGSDRNGGGVSVYIHISLNFKTRSDLSTNCGDIESLTLEIISEKRCNTIVFYTDHQMVILNILKTFSNFSLNTKNSNKNVFVSQEISIFTYWIITSIKKQNYLNLTYQNSFSVNYIVCKY